MRKLISAFLAASLVAAMGISAFAVPTLTTGGTAGTGSIQFAETVYNSDYKPLTGSNDPKINGNSIENIRPDSTYYIPITKLTNVYGSSAPNANLSTNTFVETNVVGDKNLYRVKFDKEGDGRGLVDSVSIVSDKKGDTTAVGFTDRGAWLKIVTKQSFAASEKKVKLTIEIKANSAKQDEINKGFESSVNGNFVPGDKYIGELNLWVNNVVENGDSTDKEPGDAFVFNPTPNEENTIVWGDDRAALKFDSDNAASKFYAKLSTKAIPGFWTEYADPINAEVWFYDFVGNPDIPSTSRATLTLGIPWKEGSNYAPKISDVYIYHMDKDGILTDVTGDFSYSEDQEEIPGWSVKTRTLGTYIISDKKLLINEDGSSEEIIITKPENNVNIEGNLPSTGSTDMVNVAVICAVASLAAAGAVSFRKK